eukprot:jgi/Orpsp1_1/1175002/evm.model.c7180000052278.1
MGKNGAILNIENLNNNSNIIIKNSIIKENVSATYGSVVYSMSDLANLYVNFDNCVFSDNKSFLSNDNFFFSYSIDSEPNVSNSKELKTNSEVFSTNPSKLLLTSDSDTSVVLFSGETISNTIKFKIVNDYNNEYDIYNISNYDNVSDLFYYNIETNDARNVAIIGENLFYCSNDYCSIPPVKIVGNPGNYKIKLIMKYFAGYKTFANNVAEVDLIIKECNLNNTSFVNDIIDDSGFKSCFKPKCDLSCNAGKCVNNNVCSCEGTPYTGLQCNEYYKLKRIIAMDYISRIIGCILIFISGFTLVFGSFVVKAYRIYKIYNFGGVVGRSINKSILLLVIFIISLINIVIVCLWLIYDEIELKLYYTNSLKEYERCSYPKTINL